MAKEQDSGGLSYEPIQRILEQAKKNAKERDIEFRKSLAKALLQTFPDRDNFKVSDEGIIINKGNKVLHED